MIIKGSPAAVARAAPRSRDDWAYMIFSLVAFAPLFVASLAAQLAVPRSAASTDGKHDESIFHKAAANARSAISVALTDH